MGFLSREKKRLSTVKIRRALVDGLLEVSREVHPREFIGLLRAERGVISEVIIPPFSIYGLGESSFSPYDLPIDPSLVGSVHSHPSGDPRPSKQDVNVAFSFGFVHLIITYPYSCHENIYAYDKEGKPLKLIIIE
ncbi:MAG: Mov34/MPN/PAD-1 family protein [Candidatus Jordarchaeales archaeon]